MLFHPSTDFEIQKYYQNESKFNGFYSKSYLFAFFVVSIEKLRNLKCHMS